MQREITMKMCEKEYEDFVSMVKNWDEERIWIALRTIDPEYLWQSVYTRFGEYKDKVDALNKIARV